ncbi:MAG: hypothetical protein ACTHLB_03475 [Parafilimonas sp.]
MSVFSQSKIPPLHITHLVDNYYDKEIGANAMYLVNCPVQY